MSADTQWSCHPTIDGGFRVKVCDQQGCLTKWIRGPFPTDDEAEHVVLDAVIRISERRGLNEGLVR